MRGYSWPNSNSGNIEIFLESVVFWAAGFVAGILTLSTDSHLEGSGEGAGGIVSLYFTAFYSGPILIEI